MAGTYARAFRVVGEIDKEEINKVVIFFYECRHVG